MLDMNSKWKQLYMHTKIESYSCEKYFVTKRRNVHHGQVLDLNLKQEVHLRKGKSRCIFIDTDKKNRYRCCPRKSSINRGFRNEQIRQSHCIFEILQSHESTNVSIYSSNCCLSFKSVQCVQICMNGASSYFDMAHLKNLTAVFAKNPNGNSRPSESTKSSSGSKGGDPGVRLPTDQNFFNFIGFSENVIKILGRRPPRDWDWRSSGSASEKSNNSSYKAY